MGSNFMWLYCIPVVGGTVGFIDFCYVLIKGDEALSKYANNTKFWVLGE
jgi:hypothetical protein